MDKAISTDASGLHGNVGVIRPDTVFRLFVYDRIDPSDASLDWLEAKGVLVTRGTALWQTVGRYSEDEIIAAARSHDAVMGASGARFTRRVIEALPQLRFISKFGIGVDTIDIAAANEHGVLVSNTADPLSIQAVAEHALSFILGLRKNVLHWTPQYMQAGGWRPGYFSEVLVGSKIGLVGLGRIARELVKRLAGWEVIIQAYDPYVTDPPPGVTMTDLSTLLAESDVISLHATPNADNRHMINAAALSTMKPTAILINVARAWLVDASALRDALVNGQIAGAAIDVFDFEPPDRDDPLFKCHNAMFSPHAASWTRTGLEHTGWSGANNLWSMMRGEINASIVNPEAATLNSSRRADL